VQLAKLNVYKIIIFKTNEQFKIGYKQKAFGHL